MNDQQCAYVKEGGARCRVDFGVNPDTGFCWSHDPARRKKAQRARRLGAQKTAEKRRRASPIDPNDVPAAPRTVEAAADMAAWAARAMLLGEITRHEARDLASILRAVLDALKASDVSSQIEELQAKVERLNSEPDLEAVS